MNSASRSWREAPPQASGLASAGGLGVGRLSMSGIRHKKQRAEERLPGLRNKPSFLLGAETGPTDANARLN
jgi:hypothetical protein